MAFSTMATFPVINHLINLASKNVGIAIKVFSSSAHPFSLYLYEGLKISYSMSLAFINWMELIESIRGKRWPVTSRNLSIENRQIHIGQQAILLELLQEVDDGHVQISENRILYRIWKTEHNTCSLHLGFFQNIYDFGLFHF
jgi:hypothetical protein